LVVGEISGSPQVGALAVFLVRHKSLMSGGDQSLAQVGRVIAINMV